MKKIDGVLIINKEKGCTSHDVVSKIRKILKTKQVGHTGTLDPNATGVLPILVGKATKISKHLIEHDKEYVATLKLGKKRDTGDVEGKVIETKDVDKNNINEEFVQKILNTFLGKQKQIPPMYSSIKVNGKKLYEYARNGEKVEIEPRDIEIFSIKLEKINKEESKIIFRISCSKGTYIRSLCEDIAEKLETVGYMSDLIRTKVDNFNIEEAINIEKLEKGLINIEEKIIPIEKVFEKNETIIIEEKRMTHFLNGVQLTYKKQDGLYKIYNENKEFMGLGIIKNELLKRDVII